LWNELKLRLFREFAGSFRLRKVGSCTMLQKRGFSEVFGGVGFRRANIHNPMRNELLV
jgi:hypothetical protein